MGTATADVDISRRRTHPGQSANPYADFEACSVLGVSFDFGADKPKADSFPKP
jgi:hypothetical protein